MAIEEQIADRIQKAILGAFVSLYVAIIVPVLNQITESTGSEYQQSVDLYIWVLKISPDLFTIAGLLSAIIIAGPIFGLIGWGMETAGAAALLFPPAPADPGSELARIIVGAVLVVLGSFLWRWKDVWEFLSWFLADYRRTRYRRR